MLHTTAAGSKRTADGFTLIELMVVIAVIATLAVLLLPTLAKSRQQAVDVQCLSNLRQLTMGWRMYAADNNDILAPNDYPYTTEFAIEPLATQKEQFNWVCGTMEQPIDAVGGLATQVNELINPVGTALSSYITNPYIYHCPADNYIDSRSHRPHVRSYSMNSAIGTIWWDSYNGNNCPRGAPVGTGWLEGSQYIGGCTSPTWLTYGKMSSFTRPGPANTWVIMDENALSINDAALEVSAVAAPGKTYLIDYPSGNHNNGAGIAFVDGHALIHTWLDSRTYTPQLIQPGQGSQNMTLQTPDNQDCFYLAPLTSALR